jgi:hypothetical protein
MAPPAYGDGQQPIYGGPLAPHPAGGEARPFYGPANISGCPWPPLRQEQPHYEQLQFQQQHPVNFGAHQQPHQANYMANQCRNNGPFPSQYNRQDPQGPFQHAQGPVQGSQQGWSAAAASSAQPRQTQQLQQLEQPRPPLPTPTPTPPSRDSRNSSHAHGPSRRNVPTQGVNTRPPNSPRLSRVQRGGPRRTANDVPRHASPPRRERLRDALGRTSEHRARLRVPASPSDDHRSVRSNRSRNDEREE